MSHLYEENGSVRVALEVVKKAEEKVEQQLKLERQDPPVPSYMEGIYLGCLRVLKALKVKFMIHVRRKI